MKVTTASDGKALQNSRKTGSAAPGFEDAFVALTGYTPLRWQYRLFRFLEAGDVPGNCDLPTGLGKTFVIPIWLIALALQAQKDAVTLPRRLIYVVDRRTVVDQATDTVQDLRDRLLNPDDPRWKEHADSLHWIAEALGKIVSTAASFLAVSTLRGELADNEEWKVDPSRPAIIVGTVDMIGSKLLFSGYGDSRYWRPPHAGLIGQDALIVLDEAHLIPAFGKLLEYIRNVQCRAQEPRPIRIMQLTATLREGVTPQLTLEEEDENDGLVRERLDASKVLRISNATKTKLVSKIVELANAHEDEACRVLIYACSPEVAQDVVKQLRHDKAGRVEMLTGTIRGYERDRLLRKSAVYLQFKDGRPPEKTIYLVCTSAGEVGIDIDADHMVSDLTTLDSLAQRLGRVNRRGGAGRTAQVDIAFVPQEGKETDIGSALCKTANILREWVNDDANCSPRVLRQKFAALSQSQREEAFSPSGTAPPLSDILLDAWSLTSIMCPLPGRPEIAPYLHGLTAGAPETYVAWRSELSIIGDGVPEDMLDDWFRSCRIETNERLRDTTDRIRRKLTKLLARRRNKNKDYDEHLILLDEYGHATSTTLSKITTENSNVSLDYRTVVLPTALGGLGEDGTLDYDAEPNSNRTVDVAEADRKRERWIITEGDDGTSFERLLTGERHENLSRKLAEQQRILLSEQEETSKSRYLGLFVRPEELALAKPEQAKAVQLLEFHLNLIANEVDQIAAKVNLPISIRGAISLAARWHDRGKARPIWQRYACNDASEPLAKSRRYLHGRALGGYRHEFGSLLDASADPMICKHAEADLVLHLISSHHGWSRPHFEPRAWDRTYKTSKNECASTEAMRRFCRLQQRFGRWGLAWIEALLRCADISASRDTNSSTETRGLANLPV